MADMHGRLGASVLCLMVMMMGARMAGGLELNNGTVRLVLDVDEGGVPRIAAATWAGDNAPVFAEREKRGALDAWIPKDLLPASSEEVRWTQKDDATFLRGEATRALAGGLMATWVVEAPREGSLVRACVRMSNGGNDPKAVEWFPVWTGSWKLEGAEWLRWWEALSFVPHEEAVAKAAETVLHSRLHSSDTAPSGQNPYWCVGGKRGRIYMSLAWCGGWRADLRGTQDGLDFRVVLPPEETQLVLNPGETITGPVMTVMATRKTDDASARASWLAQQAALARKLYGGPGPWFPLGYNNWYTTRFGVDAAFLRRQVAAMEPYHFDVFIVDAGWYKGMGQWTPEPTKFQPGEFEDILKGVKDKGVKVGIWTCPQFVKASGDALPPEVDQPGFYEKFIDGHLLDLAGTDFSSFLVEHVAQLRSRYFADWWKYDQLFFAEKTRQGVMKNVAALERALLAVRKANRDLDIENCQSGGRMINDLTVYLTQTTWIRDGGGTGMKHARDNIKCALGALDFMPPWTVNRWTNNPDRNNPNDDEFTRLYCRSAMAGTWGIVADLPKIAERQRAIILKEADHYRRLNALKNDCRYDIHYPTDGADFAGVAFWNAAGSKAGILLYRWDARGSIEGRMPLPGLGNAGRYRVEDADTGRTAEISGDLLRSKGLPVTFDGARWSALIFVEAF